VIRRLRCTIERSISDGHREPGVGLSCRPAQSCTKLTMQNLPVYVAQRPLAKTAVASVNVQTAQASNVP